ncbi:glycoside hydrolase domain-containing protein [Kitasatospora sp. NPDC059646]|uniref:glycoside hydrolase domain-containing protein n=1 Tax=Kitasatospora sp. NPDC059646 TaxID=3346893 RepID=UPI00369095EE
MRRLWRAAGRVGAVVLTVACAATGTGGWTAAADRGAEQQVEYRGVRLRVPADWPVVDLAAAPRTCVRLDVSAVYLGTPGEDQDCPAHLPPGRADGLLVQPARTGRGAAAPETVAPGRPVPQRIVRDAAGGHQLRARLGGTGLEVTAGWATDPDRVRQILETATATADPVTAEDPADDAPAGAAAPRTDVAGYAFDRCAAPSAAAMRAWAASSPYRAVGVYIGGPSQACVAPGADWVADRAAEGWAFMPIYVGHQAARGNLLVDADPAVAGRQGAAAADDAVRKAEGLGFRPGAVLYNDMENYDRDRYRDRVLAYLAGWTRQLHARGYRSGVYAGAASGVPDLSARWGDAGYPEPDVLWSAAWNSHHDVTDAGMGLPAGAGQWTGGRRAHQYAGDVTETYGGFALAVDADYLDVTSPAGAGRQLFPGRRLTAGRSISSASATLTVQADGDLTVRPRGGGPALWSAGTGGNPGAFAVQQDDGNLVVYRGDGGPGAGGALWSTGTWRSPGAYTELRDDGDLVVYGRDGGALWFGRRPGLNPAPYARGPHPGVRGAALAADGPSGAA